MQDSRSKSVISNAALLVAYARAAATEPRRTGGQGQPAETESDGRRE